MNWQLPCGAHPLAPFDHQVAGQSSMLIYDDTTVCKPLIARENFVYQTLPEGLREFTPEYRGEIEVSLAEKDGDFLLYGLGINQESHDNRCDCSTASSESHTTHGSEKVPLKGAAAESTEADESKLKNVRAPPNQCMIGVLQNESYDVCRPGQGMDHGDVMVQHPGGLNPWSFKNHKRLVDKMRKSEHSQNSIRFILLKNVVADFKYPCILDLKVGSRLHGDEANAVKVESQSRKCRETTSSTIGVRLCGMQIYQKNIETYASYDKFYGRTLTNVTFKKELIRFLHNGVRFRSELLQPIITQLSKLIHRLRNVDTYRFYASSLLIMYDGAETSEASTLTSSCKTDSDNPTSRKNGLNLPHQPVKISTPSLNQDSTTGKIHANASLSESVNESMKDNDSSHNIGYSQSCSCSSDVDKKDIEAKLHSKHSLASESVSISSPDDIGQPNSSCDQFASEELNLGTRKSSCEVSFNDLSYVCNPEQVDDPCPFPQADFGSDNASGLPLFHENVDVKMIDFAHTTYAGFPWDKCRHQGPDMDYIKGLTNLKMLFQEIMNDS